MATKMTRNGVSTTRNGEEQFERFAYGRGRNRKHAYMYEYRTPDGELFSICKATVEECRAARDRWMKNRG